MMRLKAPKTPLTLKLVIAFILAAVPPILLASTVATSIVSSSVNENIERWLHVTTRYLFLLMDETEEHLAAVATLETTSASMTGPAPSFPQSELKALANLEVEYLVLRDEKGAVLFSTPGLKNMSPMPLYEGSPFHWIELEDGSQKLVIVATHVFTADDGSSRSVMLGAPFSIDLAQQGPEPITIRLLLPDDEGFSQVYSSEDGEAFTMPQEAIKAIRYGENSFFIAQGQWTEPTPNSQVLLTPIRGPGGNILAVAAVSATILPPDSFVPSSRFLFWLFFLFGTLLSGGIGYLLAKGFVSPIRELRHGVREIARGDLDYRVSVTGNDEITELARGFNSMAADLKTARSELEKSARLERTRMLGEIALGFAHEIRNPLVVIKTSAQIAQKALPENIKEFRLLGYVADEVGRIDTLLTEFLNFAKPAPPSLAPFRLRPLVEEILEISTATLEQQNIRHSFTDTGVQAKVLGERDQIRQVILNLILNAMQAMPEGGDLDVTIYERKQDGTICLDIRDTGVGVPEKFKDTIHMPFITSKKNSLGLGLAKVYAVIEEHGGKVSFSSPQGQGTVFTICLNTETRTAGTPPNNGQ